jgi:ubiquinone/menaquinone biosynthesis C-methylase UbiE
VEEFIRYLKLRYQTLFLEGLRTNVGPNLDAVSLLPDYSQQARAYDSTRGASPSVLEPLRQALAGAPGTKLLDIGGGTGNYALALALAGEGWQPLVFDRSAPMLAQADAKGLATAAGDAAELPFADQSFDAVMLVAMIHHVGEPARALEEAQRVLRNDGRGALMVFAREDVEASCVYDYFPVARPWMDASHPPLAELRALLPTDTQRIPIVYKDMLDGSMAALLGHPELLLQRSWRTQTSFFERMERDHPDELRAGLAQLQQELAEGRAPRVSGGASLLAWVKP